MYADQMTTREEMVPRVDIGCYDGGFEHDDRRSEPGTSDGQRKAKRDLDSEFDR